MSAGGVARLKDEVLSWSGVTAQPHRFGGIEFVWEGKEIGHLHGDHLVDALLPRAERDRWIEAGKAKPHHMYPESGWVSVYLRTEEEIANAIEILRAKYELMWLRRANP